MVLGKINSPTELKKHILEFTEQSSEAQQK